MGCVVLPSKIHLNNILPWSLTKKFKINEIQSKYQKKEKTKKNMAPTVFEPGSYGVRGRAPFHWSS
jgi:hypothetical protein